MKAFWIIYLLNSLRFHQPINPHDQIPHSFIMFTKFFQRYNTVHDVNVNGGSQDRLLSLTISSPKIRLSRWYMLKIYDFLQLLFAQNHLLGTSDQCSFSYRMIFLSGLITQQFPLSTTRGNRQSLIIIGKQLVLLRPEECIGQFLGLE